MQRYLLADPSEVPMGKEHKYGDEIVCLLLCDGGEVKWCYYDGDRYFTESPVSLKKRISKGADIKLDDFVDTECAEDVYAIVSCGE